MPRVSEPGRPTLRVVTLNFWGDHPPLGERLEAAAAGLAALAPDVVFLQEVRGGVGLERTDIQLAQLLARQAGAAYEPAAYGCAVRSETEGLFGPGSAPGEEGLAILARYPVSRTAVVELPEARPDERRILLSARLEVDGYPVNCHTTHLHWRLIDGVARERQVAAVDAAARAFDAEDAPHVLGGDFNAPPDADEVRFLCGRHTLEGRRAVWQDSFARARADEAAGPAGLTWARRNPYTSPLGWLELDRRIDYLFVSPERRDGRGRVLDARVVLDAPSVSDHFGLLADVGL